MAELNIVDLIENQPIAKLTNTYNIKLLKMIKETFTSDEEQLFVASFYVYLNYDAHKEYVVDLDKVWAWLNFSTKQKAEKLLISTFKEGIDYTINSTKCLLNLQVKQTNDVQRGGHNIKKIMLTVKCFKSLCLKAQTKKADEIHDYYMKMEEIMHRVIEEEGAELKQKLIDSVAEIQQMNTALQYAPEISNHNTLLRKFGTINGSLIYIVRIKQFDNGSYIIKIGESRKGIRGRLSEFKTKYGPHVIILDCFTLQNSVGLEKYLHRHPSIFPAKVTNLEGHEQENELFLIGGQLTYSRVQEIIDTALPQFNDIAVEYEKLKLEIETLRNRPDTNTTTCIMDHTILQEILQTNRQLIEHVRLLEASQQDLMVRINTLQKRTITPITNLPDPHLGPRLQQIHPETMQLLRVYESVTECMKEDATRKRPSLNKAARENTIYRGFRWRLIDRAQDASSLNAIEPTKKTLAQKNGYIAKVNETNTAIVAVYLDRKTAAQKNQCASIGSLDWAVKNHTLKDGFYYQLYAECDEALRIAFEAIYGTIILYHDGVGQYMGDQLTAEYTSRYDCTVRTGMTQKSIAKVLDQPILYSGHYYRSRGSKLSIP